MKSAIVITPVKNSLETTRSTIEHIHESNPDLPFLVYNDYSTDENTIVLRELTQRLNIELINLADLTNTPSPNYDRILQDAQERALSLERHLIIVESDVTVAEDTLRTLIDYTNQHKEVGLAGAITVDKNGEVNFPYLKFKDKPKGIFETNRSLSFCCTLISNQLLQNFSFKNLDPEKDWYDTIISKVSIQLGYVNVIFTSLPVVHHPHGSRPWKLLKYKNPLKYYFLKFIRHRDKI